TGDVLEIIMSDGSQGETLALFVRDTISASSIKSFAEKRVLHIREEIKKAGLKEVYDPYYILNGRTAKGQQIVLSGVPVLDTFGYVGSFEVTQFSKQFIYTSFIGPENNLSLA